MGKLASVVVKAQRASAWRNRIARYSASKQSVEAFCRSEAVSSGSFYRWRARLRALEVDVTVSRSRRAAPGAAPFIDLGAVSGPAVSMAAAGSAVVPDLRPANIAVHIDLGCGVVLTIVRH
jgi:hypothetical protein